jgi:KaiC/GvpD/RAD55 family RecA-like ATPase
VVIGSAGAGKTIFALQYLYNGIKNFKENGLYISLEEKKEKVYRHMKRFGWDFTEFEKKKKFVYMHYPAEQIEKFIEEAPYIKDTIKEKKIQRVVIDSATSLLLLQQDAYLRRQAFLKLISIINSWGCTVLLTSEARERRGNLTSKFDIEFLVDAVVAIHQIKNKDVKDKAIEIVKMRGTDHSNRLIPLKIEKKGVVLYPTQRVFLK